MAGSGKPDHMTYGCPCSSGLTCHGSGRYDIPIGETGNLMSSCLVELSSKEVNCKNSDFLICTV